MDDVNFPRTGGEASFKYSFNNCYGSPKVSAITEPHQSWVSINTNGDTVVVSADAVPVSLTNPRNATVKFTVADVTCNKSFNLSQDGSSCSCDSLSATSIGTLDNETVGVTTLANYEYDDFCVDSIKGVSFSGGGYGNWVTDIGYDGNSVFGNVIENPDRDTRKGLISISGSMKEGIVDGNVCVKVLNISQSGIPCDCEGLTSQLKQIKHMLPATAVNEVYIGSGNTNDCGTIQLIKDCEVMDAEFRYLETNPDIYEIYASTSAPREGDIIPRTCAFNLKITLKDGTVLDTCRNNAVWLTQTDKYCGCEQFTFSLPQTFPNHVTYDAATRTFRINVDRSSYSFYDLLYIDNTQGMYNLTCTHKIYQYFHSEEERDNSNWYTVTTRSTYVSGIYKDSLYISVRQNDYSGERTSRCVLKYMVMGDNDFDGDECESYNLEITQSGYGNCCDYDFEFITRSLIIGAVGSSYIEFSTKNYPVDCFKDSLRIKIYEYYEGYDCNNMDSEKLVSEYFYVRDTSYPSSYEIYYFKLVSGSQTWLVPSGIYESELLFTSETNSSSENRSLIIVVSLDKCPGKGDCAYLQQEGMEACTCESANLSFSSYDDTKTTTSITRNYCSSNNASVSFYFNTDICSNATFDYKVYTDSNFQNEKTDFTNFWFRPNSISTGSTCYFYYSIDRYDGLEETKDPRCIYVKIFMHIDTETVCELKLTICQEYSTCENIKKVIRCYDGGSRKAYSDTSSNFADISPNCGEISATTLHQWSGESATYSEANACNWITKIRQTKDSSYCNLYADFPENYTGVPRYATFNVYRINSDGSMFRPNCYKECTIMQDYEHEIECNCDYARINFSNSLEYDENNNLKAPLVFDTYREIGRITISSYDLCNKHYFCVGSVNYTDIISYRLEYSYGEIIVSYRIDKDANDRATNKIEDGSGAAFHIYLFLSSSESGITNHLKDDGTCVSTDTQCDNQRIALLFLQNA